jgi:hypothetical protein
MTDKKKTFTAVLVLVCIVILLVFIAVLAISNKPSVTEEKVTVTADNTYVEAVYRNVATSPAEVTATPEVPEEYTGVLGISNLRQDYIMGKITLEEKQRIEKELLKMDNSTVVTEEQLQYIQQFNNQLHGR